MRHYRKTAFFISKSGIFSGKLHILFLILFRALASELNRMKIKPGKFREMRGTDKLDKVINDFFEGYTIADLLREHEK